MEDRSKRIWNPEIGSGGRLQNQRDILLRQFAFDIYAQCHVKANREDFIRKKQNVISIFNIFIFLNSFVNLLEKTRKLLMEGKINCT